MFETVKKWLRNVFSSEIWTTLIITVGIIIAAIILVKIIRRVFRRRESGNFRVLEKFLILVIWIVAVFGILMQITPLKDFAISLLASSGVIAVVLGFAAQESFGNMICGMVLAFTKPFVIGDFIVIQTEGIQGTVEDITLRHTVIKDASNRRVIIPNSVINKSVLETSYDADTRICNYLEVSVAYDADIDRAMAIMREETLAHPLALDVRTQQDKENGAPDVLVRVINLGPSGIDLRAYVWTEDTFSGTQILSDLRHSVKSRFDREGIEIPFPYTNVILKSERKKDQTE